MDTLETRIEHIESKDAIRELTAQYCHAVVDGDAEKIVSLFSEGGTFRAHNLAPQGSKALLEFYTAGISQKTHKPFIQNHVIELLGKSKAKGRCSVEIRVNQEGQAYTQSGHYLDSYIKVDGTWKFEERHYHRYHNAPWDTGWSPK